MERTALIDLDALRAVSLFVSDEMTRYYLMGVCLEIEATSVTYIATDGHRIMVTRQGLLKDQAENTLLGSFIIPADSCKPFKRSKNSIQYANLSEPDKGNLSIKYLGQSYGFKPIDGTFPDWRRVLATEKRADLPILSFNWDYVAAFKKAAEILDIGTPVLRPGSEMGPALVHFSKDANTVGAVMPMAMKGMKFDGLPKWAVRTDKAA